MPSDYENVEAQSCVWALRSHCCDWLHAGSGICSKPLARSRHFFVTCWDQKLVFIYMYNASYPCRHCRQNRWLQPTEMFMWKLCCFSPGIHLSAQTRFSECIISNVVIKSISCCVKAKEQLRTEHRTHQNRELTKPIWVQSAKTSVKSRSRGV